MGSNFIGIEELQPFVKELNLQDNKVEVPEINYDRETLERCYKDFILILGLSHIKDVTFSIMTLRDHFGCDPNFGEPCFYNQDWYINEKFIKNTLADRWYLLKREVIDDTRAIMPDTIINHNIKLPSATLCVYTFFANYFAYGDVLWKHDFVWCADKDHNGDRIYVGKYNDEAGVNKNGFSIHRHLSLRTCYGAVSII